MGRDGNKISEIIFGCLSRDEACFGIVFRRYYEKYANYFLRGGVPAKDVDVVCNDFFLHVWENIDRFALDFNKSEEGVQTHFENWLYKIAAWKRGEYLRSKTTKRSQFKHGFVSIDDKQNGSALQYPLEAQPDETLSFRAKAGSERGIIIFASPNEILYMCLEALGSAHREVVDLRFFENRTYEEIAEITQTELTLTTLRKRAERGIKALKEQMTTCTIDAYFVARRETSHYTLEFFVREFPLLTQTNGGLSAALKTEDQCLIHCQASEERRRIFASLQGRSLDLITEHFIHMKTYAELTGGLKNATILRKKLNGIVKELNQEIVYSEAGPS